MRRSFTALLLPAILFIITHLPPAAAETPLPTPSVAADLLDDADRAYQDQNWAEASKAYEALARENPYNGLFWYRLATAHYQLKEYEASARAYEKAAALGQSAGTSYYNLGCDYALMGETEKAIAAIERAIAHGLQNRERLLREDHDLDSIRDTEAWRERILPAVPDGVSRQEGWRIDLDYLTMRMEQTHYDVYRNISREQWAGEVDRITRDVPRLADYEIVVALMRLIARVGDGHSAVRTPSSGDLQFHVIPLQFYIFKDGVFVRSAAAEYAGSLVGKRVVAIGETPIEKALELAASVTQRDNAMQIKWIAPRFLSIVEILDALDISDGIDHADVVVADASGKRSTVRLEAVPLTPAIRGDHVDGFVTMADGASAETPLWRKNPEAHYWFEYLEQDKLVYFQFNSVRNQNGESIEEFADRLFGFVADNDVEALVIDVRTNHGGNNFLNQPLIHHTIRSDKINRPGHLFLVTGRETFSACQNFTNQMEWETEVLVVGEPTGSSPNFVGEGNPIELPYSGLVVNGSSRYWQDSLSDDYREWIAPDLVAEMTSDDFRNNNDPAMRVIMQYLAHRAGDERSAAR